nr:MAG TPA: hypothetical protein [Caudoviricetes sp.]
MFAYGRFVRREREQRRECRACEREYEQRGFEYECEHRLPELLITLEIRATYLEWQRPRPTAKNSNY